MAESTSESAARDFTAHLAERWCVALGGQVLGIYLLGSLAHGGFSARYSDIDVGVTLDAPLEPARLDGLKDIAKEAAPGPAGKLSIFWSDRGFSAGRFPPLDRMDYLDHRVALFERERAAPARLSREEIRAYLRGQPMDAFREQVRRFAGAASLDGAHKPYLRAHLYPARLVYSWETGRMASNDDAVALLHEKPPAGLDVALIDRALDLRHQDADMDALFAERARLAAQLAACERLVAN